MKSIVIIVWLLVGAGTIGISAFMMYYKLDNWGWFLFAGLAILAGLTAKDSVTIYHEEEDEC